MYEKVIKRMFDLLFSLIGIVMLLPIWIIVPILIKSEDGGPIFYSAPRIGKDGKKIAMYKFRSMKPGSEDIRNPDGSTFNSDDDPRLTRVGKVIRKTSIDELPQLFNVIKGEMSIVGPRASSFDMLGTYKPDEIDKMKVRPGITGLSQAYYRNSISLRKKRLLDASYANHVSLLLDLKILLRTVKTVIMQESLYTNAERYEQNKEVFTDDCK